MHHTWGSVFAAEMLACLYPSAHLLIADHDSAPLTLFEAGQLLRFADLVLQMDDSLPGRGGTGLLLSSESRAEVNAGFVLVPRSGPALGACPVQPADLVALLEQSRRRFQTQKQAPLGRHVDSVPIASAQGAAKRRPFASTPLGDLAAWYPCDFLHGWAMMGEWINLLMFPLPADGTWRRKGSAAFLPPFLQHRRPSVARWARAAFEQGVLGCLAAFETVQCAVVELPGDRFLQATSASDAAHAQPLMVHAHAGKDALTRLSAVSRWQTFEQGLLGTSLPPSWMGEVWKVSAGLRITFGERVMRL